MKKLTKEFIEELKKEATKNVSKIEARKVLLEAGLITKTGKIKKLVKDTHLK